MVNQDYYNLGRAIRGTRVTSAPLRPNQRDRKSTRDMDAAVQEIGLGGLAIFDGAADFTSPPAEIGNIRGKALEFVHRALDPRSRL